jgi:hypothetical protein
LGTDRRIQFGQRSLMPGQRIAHVDDFADRDRFDRLDSAITYLALHSGRAGFEQVA